MFGVPLVILGAMELGLPVAGYGYPTDFFLPAKTAGRNFYVPNLAFDYRLAPLPLVRTPMPQRIAATKGPGSYRIFLFGESAALGDPDMSYGVGRSLQVLLSERFPDTRFQVICVAITAINSNIILPIAHDGDLSVIYMGNNEMSGPISSRHIRYSVLCLPDRAKENKPWRHSAEPYNLIPHTAPRYNTSMLSKGDSRALANCTIVITNRDRTFRLISESAE